MRHLFSDLLFNLVIAVSFAVMAVAQEGPPGGKITIALAGDSTVTSNAGWGDGFKNCLTENAECINLSRGGRSSGSFVKEGLWKSLLEKKPDYVLIQFGHNDQPGHGAERESDPETTYKANMLRYVDDARAAGIKPVLVTSLSRRQWGSDGKIHSTLVPYVEVVKAIAAEKKVPLIDLHAKSIELYESLGKEAVNKLSPVKNADPNSKNSDTAAKENGGIDGTHLNAAGSKVIGPIVAAELAKAVPELSAFIKTPKKTAASGTSKTITVATDDSGDFKTVQAAINAAPEKSDQPITIHIRPGTYVGQLIVPKSKTFLVLEGEDAASTHLTWDRNVNEEKPPGADKFNPGLQVKADNFAARNLTIENTSGDHGQALAVRLDADRAVISHCRLIGWQDTLMANSGRDYFEDCYITGRVDFIYGSGTVWFENCEVHSRNGGYLTASNAPENQPFGFVFNHCKLTGDDLPWQSPDADVNKPRKTRLAALGRPWRQFASVTFMNCEMGDHIKPEGWDNWGKPDYEKTARYAEFGNTGPGAQPDKRVAWAKQLSPDEAEKITLESVLGGNDHWKPARHE
jgi:pectinesterase